MPETEKKKSRWTVLQILILLLLIGVMCYSGYKLFESAMKYKRSADTRDKIADIFYEELSEEEDVSKKEESSYLPIDTSLPELSPAKEKQVSIYKKYLRSLDKLKEQNKDTVGWIRFEGMKIDFVVMQGETNDSYLHTDFFGDYDFAGCPFIDSNNLLGRSLQNYILYGHHMLDGTVFAPLMDYKNADFWKEHKTYQLLLTETVYDDAGRPGRSVSTVYEAEIFACVSATEFEDWWITCFASEQDKEDYLRNVLAHALYPTGVRVTTEDKIVMISTCDRAYDYNHGRFLIFARLNALYPE